MPSKDEPFELKPPPAAARQERLGFPKPAETARADANGGRRRKDTVRLKWDSKPRRAPSPRDIEFQTAEVVIPNPARDAATLPFSFRDGILDNEQLDKAKMNRLIWGDNLLAMQVLLAQGYEGKIDLIYIDPPFDSKADYSHRVTLGDAEVTKEPSVIERLAYRDTWEGGTDSYLDMLYPRVNLMRRLLSERGSIYIHIGPGISSYVKVLCDEVLGLENFRNEVVWRRRGGILAQSRQYGVATDNLLFYTKTDAFTFHPPVSKEGAEDYVEERFKYVDENGRRYRLSPIVSPSYSRNLIYDYKGYKPPKNGWSCSRETMERWDREGKLVFPRHKDQRIQRKQFLDEWEGRPIQSLWTDIPPINPQANERTGFDTQKPCALLQRILDSSSDKGDLVADFFCGSGTTLAVAEKLGRRWIGCDFGKVGIQVTRARLVEADAKPFLIENIGNYQREMIYLHGGRISEMQRIILKLYGATPHPQHADLGTRQINGNGGAARGGDALLYRVAAKQDSMAAKQDSTAAQQDSTAAEQDSAAAERNNPHAAIRNPQSLELVYVGYPDRPTTAKKAMELQKLAATLDGTGYRRLVILAWDYDYNFTSDLEARQKADAARMGSHGRDARATGDARATKGARAAPVEVVLRSIPPDVYEYLKKARREEDIEALAEKVHFHELPYLKLAKPELGKVDADGMREVTIAIERYVVFDFPVPEKEREKLREAVKNNFAVLIDYWACDFSYDGATFRSEWQAVRGNGKRAKGVPTRTTVKLKAGEPHTIAVRLVDVFGNDAAATVQLA